MKIIHTLPSLGESGGGPPRSVSQLCNELCRQRWSIGIVTVVNQNDPLVPLDVGVTLTQLEGRGAFFFDQLRAANFGSALAEIHRTTKLLIHQHGIWLRSAHSVTSYAYEHQLPLVVAPRGMLEPWSINNSKWKKKLAWMLYQKRDLERVSAFHATAHSEAESIRRMGFKQPIAVIPNGVHLPQIPTDQTMNSGPKTDKKTALFLSRIHPKKGLPMLLDAWKALSPEGWRLVIAGNDDGAHVAKLQSQIERLELSKVVSYVGPLSGEAKEQAYLNADLFVLPSYSENFGIVVAEALGYQVPVLTTTGCPWKELESESCGWWVEPTRSGIESGLLCALMASDSERHCMGLRGRELVEQRYLWPAIAEEMSLFYEWLLNGGKQPNFVV